jgi:tetrathionate reductase subunit B
MKMARYGMVTDLRRCVRCRTCYVACKRESKIIAQPKDCNHRFEYYRLRYVEWERGKYPRVERAFIPLNCVQCSDPLCVKFCPLGAIEKRTDGIIHIEKERCNGCGVCTAICPYGAVYINVDGKADGCDLCAYRLGLHLMPVCVDMCPTGARVFGDLDDTKSRIAEVIASGEAKPLLTANVDDVNIYYIPSVHEHDWEKLATDQDFLVCLAKRRIDLPPIKGVL